MKYIASVSFGKDSLAMLLLLLDKKYPIDEVIFFDTGMEFSCIYQNMNKMIDILNENKIKFTRLKSKKEFLYMMLDHEIHHRDGSLSCGYKWCGGNCRWFTTYKTQTIKNYLKKQYGKDYVEYIGIATDEPNRIKDDKLYPLIEFNMTEKDCLEYCHKNGWYWYEGEHELYDHLDRVSCWCCRNKNLKELKQIHDYFKVYWLALCELENRCGMNMKKKPLVELEKEFKLKNMHKIIKNTGEKNERNSFHDI